jgi:NADH dehydrogenase
MTAPHRIVIVGSGFAGVSTYLELRKKNNNSIHIEILLISATDYFLFTPLLHEVATGNISHNSIQLPLSTLPRSDTSSFMHGNVISIDCDSQTLLIKKNYDCDGEEDTISYDTLVLALGSETSYFNIPGAQEYSIPLKTLDNAICIKGQVIDLFEKSACVTDPSVLKEFLTIAIIGAGPTGVELAGELSDMMRKELKELYPHTFNHTSIALIDGSSTILSTFDSWFQKTVADILIKKGNVSFLLGSPVTSLGHKSVTIDKTVIKAGLVVWTAGVKARDLIIQAGKHIEKDSRSQRIRVTQYLNTESYDNIYVIGDQAFIIDDRTNKPYAQRAQFAVQQGVITAKNILAQLNSQNLTSFTWEDKGIIMSFGSGSAVAELFGIKMKGPLAWFAYRTIYLLKLPGIKSKIRTGVEWFMNLFTPRDVLKM